MFQRPKYPSPSFFFCAALLAFVLAGCASKPREGPPAPVVNVTPRQPAVIEQSPAPKETVESAAKPKPAVPAKQPTTTYAYREPGTEPPPAPASAPAAAPAPDAQGVAAKAPAAKPVPAQTPAPKPASPAPKPAAPPVAAAKPAQPRTPAAPAVAATPAPPAKPATQPPPAQPVTPPAAPQVAVATPPAAAPPAPPPPPSPESRAAEKPLAPGLPPAADTLARQADQQRQQGDYAGAAATLERSLRIAPREAYLWNRLARVRMEQGLAAQAGQLAARSNDLASGESTLKKDNWRIIAESKRRAGDTAGATEAEQRADGG